MYPPVRIRYDFTRPEVLYVLWKSRRSPHVFCTSREAFPQLGEKEGKHVIRFRYMHEHAGTNRKPFREPVQLLISGNKTQIAG
jgi:hypothetical protein